MNGCDTVCGKCDVCGPLMMALRMHDVAANVYGNLILPPDIFQAWRAIEDPRQLATLIQRALVGRGFGVEHVLVWHGGLDAYSSSHVTVIRWLVMGTGRYGMLYMSEARRSLLRVMDMPSDTVPHEVLGSLW